MQVPVSVFQFPSLVKNTSAAMKGGFVVRKCCLCGECVAQWLSKLEDGRNTSKKMLQPELKEFVPDMILSVCCHKTPIFEGPFSTIVFSSLICWLKCRMLISFNAQQVRKSIWKTSCDVLYALVLVLMVREVKYKCLGKL